MRKAKARGGKSGRVTSGASRKMQIRGDVKTFSALTKETAHVCRRSFVRKPSCVSGGRGGLRGMTGPRRRHLL
jgi:hypothetical protein